MFKHRRNVLMILLLLALAISLAACGGDEAPTPTATAVPTIAAATEAPTEAAPTEAAATEAPTEAATEVPTEAAAAEAAATEVPTEAATEAPTEAAAAEAAATEVATEAAAAAATEAAPVEASAAPTITVETARQVTEVINEKNAPFAALSPNGKQLAWFTQTGRMWNKASEICLFTFESAAKQCYKLPSTFLGYPIQLRWSPDSETIAFSENPVQLAYESDIWLFTAADGSITNLTDDGVTGDWRYEDNGADALIDFVPAWSQADGQIYFWRVKPEGEGVFTSAVYRIAPAGGEPEMVVDLSTTLAQMLPLYDSEYFFLDGVTDISPDGSKLAVMVSAMDPSGSITPNLVLIDLADPTAAPQQLLSYADFQKAMPTWSTTPAQPAGLSWTSDGKGIVTAAGSPGVNAQFPVLLFYYTDIANGSTTVVVDFSAVATNEDYYTPAPGSDLLWRAYSPWSAVLSPRGDQLLMVNDLGGYMGVLVSALPPTGDYPVLAAVTDQSTMSSSTISSRAIDGKVTVYGLLLTVKQ